LPKPISYPVKPADNLVKKIVDAVDGRRRMKEIFKELGPAIIMPPARARLMLATSAFPYLTAVRD